MELRKLISFGKGSYIISLPKQWIIKNKLKKGDMIGLEETNQGLTLRTQTVHPDKDYEKITINIEGKDLDLIKAEIISAYLNNYGVIEIFSHRLENKSKEIKEIIHSLAGLEILEQTANRLVAKDLIDITEISVSSIIRRMDIITRSMIEDTIECLGGVDKAEDLAQRDLEVNRLHFLGYRVIRKALTNPTIARSFKKDPWELQCDKSVVMRLEKIADRQKRIVRYLKDSMLDPGELAELKKIVKDMQEAYLKVMKAYYSSDQKLAYEVELTNRKRIEQCDEFFRSHTHCSLSIKGTKKQRCDYRMACAATALIIEKLKAMTTSIKYIARSVMGGE